jgi:hypothetical protein
VTLAAVSGAGIGGILIVGAIRVLAIVIKTIRH